MGVVDSATALSVDIGLPLRVFWNVRRQLGCPFWQLFQVDGLPFEMVERSRLKGNFGNEWRKARRRFGLTGPNSVLRTSDIKLMLADKSDFTSFALRRQVHIETWMRFYRPFGVSKLFRPVEPLQYRIDGIAATFNKCIGVHIRRTDNHVAIECSPTELFIEKMNAEIGMDSEVGFYLSTDDPETEHQLRAKFGDRIITHPKRSYDRWNATAIEDAVVDLFCLSRTTRILGSMGSSFSAMASELGEIPIETVAH